MTRSTLVSLAPAALLAAAPLVLTSPGSANVIADYQDDFQGTTPATGWDYLWNQPDDFFAPINFGNASDPTPESNLNGFDVDGNKVADPSSIPANGVYVPNVYANDKPIGNSANYTGLQWRGNDNAYTPLGSYPFNPLLQAGSFLRFTADGAAPGYAAGQTTNDWYDSDDGDGDPFGNGLDRYAIAAYTVQAGEGGNLAIEDSFLLLNNPTGGNGVDVRVFVDDLEIGSATIVNGSTATDFDRSLGLVNDGQTVYVAFGANGDSVNDAFTMDFSIVPEPGSLGLAAIGGLLLLGRGRRGKA